MAISAATDLTEQAIQPYVFTPEYDFRRAFGIEVSNFLISRLEGKILDTKTIHALSHEAVGLVNPDVNCIVNTSRINNIPRINKFLESVNRNLPFDGYLVGFIETKETRKERILTRYPRIMSWPAYAVDYMINRVFSKLKFTRKAYYRITKGKYRTITLTETLGRLICCGFDVVGHKKINGLTYFIAKKTDEPAYDQNPTYGAVVKMKRMGKGGKTIDVYKLRTMHPYSEYLQGYLYRQNGLLNGDKINNDFRVSRFGRLFRRFWIDELPMIFNLLKGDLKLVGVRPLSAHKLSLYSEELQGIRRRNKPGLIPPYYADMPGSFEGLMESELNYLLSYEKKPIRTDVKYFFKVFYNIFFKAARSK